MRWIQNFFWRNYYHFEIWATRWIFNNCLQILTKWNYWWVECLTSNKPFDFGCDL